MKYNTMKAVYPSPTTVSENKVQLAHGGGGKLMQQLIKDIIYPAFENPILNQAHDGAVFNMSESKIAMTTDSFVVNPLFFNGGNIGNLAINGTVNDLCCCGATPRYLTASFIIEEGFSFEKLRHIVNAMKKSASESGVDIITGDTKVVQRGLCDGIYINTCGVGTIKESVSISSDRIKTDDVLIISGKIGEHGISILSARNELGFDVDISSDTAPLNKMIGELVEKIDVHFMRDPTRGGVASTLNEIAEQSGRQILLYEELLPIPEAVNNACEMLGIDPLCVANEGCILIFVSKEDEKKALDILHKYEAGKNACRIGEVRNVTSVANVIMHTYMDNYRVIDHFSGEQLPRIC